MRFSYLLARGDSIGFGKEIVQIIYILILCIVVFLGAYYASRLLGKYNFKRTKTSNITIVEAISVGPQKTIQLLKIGSEFVLIGVTRDQITFIKDVSQEHLNLCLVEKQNQDTIPFSKYMDKVLKKKSSSKNGEES